MNATLASLQRRLHNGVGRLLAKQQSPHGNATSLVETGKTGCWDDSVSAYVRDGFKVNWETLEEVALYQRVCMTGRADQDMMAYLIEQVRENVGTSGLRGLCIGCSEMGKPEVTLFQSGLFESLEVMDIAAGLLARQQVATDRDGLPIRYLTRDLNTVELEAERYDLVFALGTVHHVAELERFFTQVNRALTPRGLFAMREYVGANRLQWSNEQLTLANALLALVPRDYRRVFDGIGVLKEQDYRSTEAEMIKVDPSEAVRALDILPVLERTLQVTRRADCGGGMLALVLHRIAGHFERDERGRTMLRSLIAIDRELFASGLLPSDYTFVMARRRGSHTRCTFATRGRSSSERGTD
jgi:SAM-dependent methyltransferase